ncbi:MAG TPA: polysaccharide lyase family protein, partial [Calditrichia bacterium]|nr:polysaccharide lyase family protein [Calditrichia bacterium]
GIPNRNGSEFLCGNRFFEWDLVKRYPEYFPEDVDYTIGESDFSKDWFIAQIPHVRDTGAPEANQLPERYHVALVKALGIETLPEHQKANALKDIEDLGLSGKYALGESTTWKINFELPEAISGELILRLAICGGETTQIAVAVNSKPVGVIDKLLIDGATNRHGRSGMWYEKNIAFSAALLHQGTNTIALTIPEGTAVKSILYDYLRLEHHAGKS